MYFKSYKRITLILLYVISYGIVSGQNLNDFNYNADETEVLESVVQSKYQFNGYTNYWHDSYSNWIRYGNLFKMSSPDVAKTVLQSKVDVAEDMGLPGLLIQEGFVKGLLSEEYSEMEQPGLPELEDALSNGNVLVFIDPASEAGKLLTKKLPNDFNWPLRLKSHQYGASDLNRIDAFYLENGGRKIFVVSSSDEGSLLVFKQLINNTRNLLDRFNMHKGWFGAETLLKSVTCTDAHPIEVIGKGMNEGNTWFVFSGYMDFLAKDELSAWIDDVKLPVVADVGFSPIFGCKDYEGLQVQSMFSKESWIDYAHEKRGYVFRQVWDTLADPFKYDGYIAHEGNKEQIDEGVEPFILSTGKLEDHALSSMVLFIEKEKPLTKETLWEAIMAKQEVGILERGKMIGPAEYRNALQLLWLDRVFLEAYYHDKVDLQATIENYTLNLTIRNLSAESITGGLELVYPTSLIQDSEIPESISIPSGSIKTLQVELEPTSDAMGKTHPVAVHFNWDTGEKSTVAMLDLPETISVHRLLYGHEPEVSFPVTIHNYSDKTSFPVTVKVLDAANMKKVVYETSQRCEIPQAAYKDMKFDLELPAGNYKVKINALDDEYFSQLGVGKAEGDPYVYAVDLNSDGINEYRMENDSVQVTLLATGARVIEYIVKSRNDNVLFKLWPEKAIDDKRPFRKRGYYPYGGFEDFLGQGSMETHQVYNAEIVNKEGDYVRVRMWTEYFGNKLEKTFTLYGNSPLLEVRFALTFKNPEANVLGPQPILELGERHWTEDVFTIPELDGLNEYRMRPEIYFGRVFFMKEGWNAAYDTIEDITYIGLFPVDQPLFLHMWLNHPRNNDAHHYYAEFQPWTPIYQKSTMYFTYYLWGTGGHWEKGVDHLRKMNLITTR